MLSDLITEHCLKVDIIIIRKYYKSIKGVMK